MAQYDRCAFERIQVSEGVDHIAVIVTGRRRRLPSTFLVVLAPVALLDRVEVAVTTTRHQPRQLHRLGGVLARVTQQCRVGVLDEIGGMGRIAAGQPQGVAIDVIDSVFAERGEIGRIQQSSPKCLPTASRRHQTPESVTRAWNAPTSTPAGPARIGRTGALPADSRVEIMRPEVVDNTRRVFISGPPGAGKSTVGRLVAERFDRSVHIGADLVRESIVSGFEQPSMPVSEGFAKQTALQREIVIAWADRMAAAGYVPIVDDAPIPSPQIFADQYASFWRDPRTTLVMLLPDAEEVRRRISERGGPFDEFLIGVVGQALSWIDELDLSMWHTVDSTGQSPEETADAVFQLVR